VGAINKVQKKGAPTFAFSLSGPVLFFLTKKKNNHDFLTSGGGLTPPSICPKVLNLPKLSVPFSFEGGKKKEWVPASEPNPPPGVVLGWEKNPVSADFSTKFLPQHVPFSPPWFGAKGKEKKNVSVFFYFFKTGGGGPPPRLRFFHQNPHPFLFFFRGGVFFFSLTNLHR